MDLSTAEHNSLSRGRKVGVVDTSSILDRYTDGIIAATTIAKVVALEVESVLNEEISLTSSARAMVEVPR